MRKQNEVASYLENIVLLVLGVLLFAFPLIFLTSTTDVFIIPKQILLASAVLVAFFLFGAKMISEGSVRLRRTPFDLPIFLFAFFVLLSAVFSVNRFDSLIAFAPLLFAILAYFIIVNLVRTKSSVLFLLSCLIISGSLVSILAVLSFFKIYVLPYNAMHFQTFSPLGSLLDQAVYLALVLPLALYLAMPFIKINNIKAIEAKSLGGAIASFIILVGLSLTIYQLLTTQKPLILPFQTGFQTAFAAISQDVNRIATGFFFGSGFGTYATDFTKFKQATFNLDQALWSFTFFRSSSFVLELLATTGILGLLSYFFICLRFFRGTNHKSGIQTNSFYLFLIMALVASFVLPFSFIIQTLLFLIFGLFAATEGMVPNRKETEYYDIELHFTASKDSILPFSSSQIPYGFYGPSNVELPKEKRVTKILPVTFFVLFILISGFLGFYVVRFAISDIIFQNSLVAATNNNGLQTYNDQVNAIGIFPYRDAYYRIYSQTNLALANSLAAQQPKGSSPSAQIQQTIYTLIQQSINSARQAVAISPQTVTNWQNLSSIYRSLIGFGQNAENFAVSTSQQALLLDPNNPQVYINLGGIYYQLGLWDDAQRQFQFAINLKPDFANAYYNLGHALEGKGDLENALSQYQTVKTLLANANDKDNLKKIDEEINVLQQKIGSEGQKRKTPAQQGSALQNQPPLGISTPSASLPKQKPPVEIPAPQTTVVPTVSPTVSPANPTPAL